MSYLKPIPFEIKSVVKNTFEIPFGVKIIKAPDVWEESNKGAGVVVAVLDSGCQVDHPDLKGRIIDTHNFVDKNNVKDVNDLTGHGTHVAGTIGAVINGKGVVGVAPEVRLLICKVVKRITEGPAKGRLIADYFDMVNAIEYCIKWRGTKQEKVRIISMSLSGEEKPPEQLHEVIQKAVQHNILVICAAGNKGDANEKTNEVGYPSYYKEVVCVGSVDPFKKLSKFTNTNNQIDLVARGEEVLSTYPKDSYATLRGTSMATPHVAGAAALIINQYEKKFGKIITEQELYNELIKRTVPLGYSKEAEGHGFLTLTKG